jgi:protein-tyrosine phosphatase
MVEDGRVWRGGQPTEAGMDYLKSIGVQRIVKLNTARLAWEKREAEKRGMTVTCFPVSFFDQTLGHPDSGRFCAICDALHSKEKVYIHCTHGQDRTGLMVGFYRTRVQSMDRAAAFREMRHHGFHTSLLGLVWTWEHGGSPLEKAGSTGRPPG